MGTPDPQPGERQTGTVSRVMGDYGFVSCETIPQDLYFKTSWFRGSPELRVGERVSFQVKTFEENVQAFYLRRADEPERGGQDPNHDARYSCFKQHKSGNLHAQAVGPRIEGFASAQPCHGQGGTQFLKGGGGGGRHRTQGERSLGEVR